MDSIQRYEETKSYLISISEEILICYIVMIRFLIMFQHVWNVVTAAALYMVQQPVERVRRIVEGEGVVINNHNFFNPVVTQTTTQTAQQTAETVAEAASEALPAATAGETRTLLTACRETVESLHTTVSGYVSSQAGLVATFGK